MLFRPKEANSILSNLGSKTMKIPLSLFLILLQTHIYASMASPVIRGTLGGRPFISKYVDVVHEDLFIKIGQNFDYASFNVKYYIHSSKDGFQIPFLFYASEYLDSFTVKIDGKEVSISKVPYDVDVPENTKLKDFSYFFEKRADDDYSPVVIEDSPGGGFVVNLHDMLYFEADIPKGQHVIEVSYRATKWVDNSDWVKEYSFRYALSPAKYWKSFGTLKVVVDATDFDKKLTSNIGAPASGSLNSITEWEFDKMPTEILQINYTPEVSKTAQLLINVGPRGLAYMTGALLATLHLMTVVWYRKKNPAKRYSPAVIVGSLLIPLFF